MATLYYYPRKLVYDVVPITCSLDVGEFLPSCEATYNMTPDFRTYDQQEQTFGSLPVSCPIVLTAPISSPAMSPVESPVSTSAASMLSPNFALSSVTGIVVWAVVKHLFS